MVSRTLKGGCHCGKIKLEITLASAPGTYDARVCDCDFCREHDAEYISDPKGSVVIRLEHLSNLKLSRQGDALAEFLSCEDCGQLIGVRWHGLCAINTRALFDRASLGGRMLASPKKLSPHEKVSRWKVLWFPKFTITSSNT